MEQLGRRANVYTSATDFGGEGYESNEIDAGGGLLVYKLLGVEYDPGPDLPYPLKIVLEYSRAERRYEVVSIEVRRGEAKQRITSEGLRSIPVAALVRGLADVGIAGHTDAKYRRREFTLPDPRLPRRLDDDAFRQIGTVHLVRQIFGDNPTANLADYYEVSKTTAHRWLAEIEKRGVMEPLVAGTDMDFAFDGPFGPINDFAEWDSAPGANAGGDDPE